MIKNEEVMTLGKKVIGIDFGTLSARAVIIDSKTGKQYGSGVSLYSHGVMDKTLPSGKKLNPLTAYQVPNDYIESLKNSINSALTDSGLDASEIEAIGFDFTATTLLAVDENFIPLCNYEKFHDEPNAYALLWKHSAAYKQAKRIEDVLNRHAPEPLHAYGQKQSAEWFFPKILYILENSPEIYSSAARFVEAADWISYILTGNESKNPSMSAFKGLWSKDTGLISNELLKKIHPQLDGIIGSKVKSSVETTNTIAGHLSEKGSQITGLKKGIPVALPIIDAHAPLAALGITQENEMMIVMGTSGCHIINSSDKKSIKGINGYGNGVIFPSLYTYEAGQICFGDCLDWFIHNCIPEDYIQKANNEEISIHEYLSRLAALQKVGEHGIAVIGWLNGNRSVYYDSQLSGMFIGITLTTKPEDIYRALIESIAYGTRRIIEEFERNGIKVNSISATGGISHKNPFLMQIFADVTGRNIKVSSVTEGAAYGSAVNAASVIGIHNGFYDACNKLKKPIHRTYAPVPENKNMYDRLYCEYEKLYRYFGNENNDIMHTLTEIKEEVCNDTRN